MDIETARRLLGPKAFELVKPIDIEPVDAAEEEAPRTLEELDALEASLSKGVRGPNHDFDGYYKYRGRVEKAREAFVSAASLPELFKFVKRITGTVEMDAPFYYMATEKLFDNLEGFISEMTKVRTAADYRPPLEGPYKAIVSESIKGGAETLVELSGCDGTTDPVEISDFSPNEKTAVAELIRRLDGAGSGACVPRVRVAVVDRSSDPGKWIRLDSDRDARTS